MAWKGTRMMLRIGNDQGPAYSVQRIGKEKILSPIPDPLSPHKGVTLVEVLLAVVILSIGIAGVLRAYAASIGALEISRDTVNTIELLKEKMADVEQDMIEQGGISAGSARGQFAEEFKDYNWTWEARTSAREGLCELAMSIFRGENGTRQFSVVTYAPNKDYEPQE